MKLRRANAFESKIVQRGTRERVVWFRAILSLTYKILEFGAAAEESGPRRAAVRLLAIPRRCTDGGFKVSSTYSGGRYADAGDRFLLSVVRAPSTSARLGSHTGGSLLAAILSTQLANRRISGV